MLDISFHLGFRSPLRKRHRRLGDVTHAATNYCGRRVLYLTRRETRSVCITHQQVCSSGKCQWRNVFGKAPFPLRVYAMKYLYSQCLHHGSYRCIEGILFSNFYTYVASCRMLKGTHILPHIYFNPLIYCILVYF